MQRSLSETVDNVRLDSGLQKSWIVNVNLRSTEAWATCKQKLTMAIWAVEAAQWRRLSPWWPLWWLPSPSSLLCHHRFIIVGVICHNGVLFFDDWKYDWTFHQNVWRYCYGSFEMKFISHFASISIPLPSKSSTIGKWPAWLAKAQWLITILRVTIGLPLLGFDKPIFVKLTPY